MIDSKHKQYIAIGFIAFLCYCNTLYGTFVFDDSEAIVKNKDVQLQRPVWNIFKNDFWGTPMKSNVSHKSYRPLTILSYRLNVYFNKSKQLEPYALHATNIVLYVIFCLLMFEVFCLFYKKESSENFICHYDPAFLSTLLYTVHPVHTEVVSALVGRADLLCSILFCISILLYHKAILKNSLFYLSTVLIVIGAAVLCKETAITALGICSLYECIQNVIIYNDWKLYMDKKLLTRHIGLFIGGLVILFLRWYVMDFTGPTFQTVDNPAAFSENIFTKVLTYNYIYSLNALLLIWPQWLCFDWSMGCIPLLESFNDTRVYFVILFWICILLAICFMYFKVKYIKNVWKIFPTYMAFSFLIIPFLPASNIFLKVGFVIAERTLLLPSAGFCLLIVEGLRNIKKHQNFLYGCFYILCIIFAIRTIQRNQDWLNETNLFQSALAVCPLNAKVHYNVAKVSADEKKNELAIKEYRKAIKLNPEYEQAMNNLANLLREQGEFNEAELLLRKAVGIRPNFAAAWMNLGIVLTNLNKSKEAEECYLKAVSYRKKYPDCYYNLGNLYLDLKRNEEALSAWQKATSMRPTHTAAWSNTLVLLDSLGRYKEAVDAGRKALLHSPYSAALHFSLANTLGKLNQWEIAEKHFLEAIRFNPDNALYHSNLGVLYHRWGKIENASNMYKAALRLDPNLITAAKNLKKLWNS